MKRILGRSRGAPVVTRRGLLGLLAALVCAAAIAGCAAGCNSAALASIPAPVATATPQRSTAEGVVITGQVKDVELDARVIHPDGQVHGFTTVTLSSDVQIVSADGSPMTLRDIKPGSMIQSAGQAVGSSAVLATKIRILPIPGPSATGLP